LIEAIRAVVERFPGMSYGFTQPIQMRVSEMLTGSTGDVTIKLFGDDLGTLAVLLERLSTLVAGVPGAVDLQPSIAASDGFINLQLKSELAHLGGLNGEAFAAFLRGQFEGERVGTLIEGRKRIPILVASAEADRPASPAGLAGRLMLMPGGELAAVGEVAELREVPGAVLIEREQGSRFAALSLGVAGRDLDSFVREARELADQQLQMPPGYRIVFGGEFENQQRAMARLLLLIPPMLLLIVGILFATFRSLALAGLILGNVPFALMGGMRPCS
jgi:cobalt-zinc-cadmium resistance protein CzcA